MVRIGGNPREEQGPDPGQCAVPPPPPTSLSGQEPPPPPVGEPVGQGIPSICSSTRQLFMLRLERFGQEVAVVQGQRLSQAPAVISSTIFSQEMPVLATHYSGCPYCERGGIVGCGTCSTISCCEPQATSFTCPGCGGGGRIGQVDVNIRLDDWQ